MNGAQRCGYQDTTQRLRLGLNCTKQLYNRCSRIVDDCGIVKDLTRILPQGEGIQEAAYVLPEGWQVEVSQQNIKLADSLRQKLAGEVVSEGISGSIWWLK